MRSGFASTKIFAATLSLPLCKIDDLTRPDHSFLKPEDSCYYLGEYTARKGYSFSVSNHLVINLKKPMDRKGKPEWAYKEQAIKDAGSLLREAIRAANLNWLSVATLVPVPPSKTKSHPEYDDRMIRILQELAKGTQADIRELVLQRVDMDPAHDAATRPRLEQLISNYTVDESKTQPKPRVIGIVDDVLTTGKHFKAVQEVLRRRFPDVPSCGIFIARRSPETTDI